MNDQSFELALAVQGGGMEDVTRVLGEHPEAVTWTNVSGGTALRAAVVGSSAPFLDVVAFLLDRGSDIDAQDKDGLTPLMFTALHGAGACAALLLSRGAVGTLTDKRGRDAASIAREYGHPDVASLIEDHAEGQRRAAAEKERLALHAKIETEAAAPHEGLTRDMPVKKVFVLKKSTP